MPLLLYLVTLSTPLLIRARPHRVGYEPLRDRIPATTVGGALASQGLFSLSDVTSGSVFVSDAYPVVGGEPAMPTPPVCIRVKEGVGSKAVEGRIICSLRALESDKPAEALLEDINNLETELGVELRASMKPAGGEVVYGCDRLREYSNVLVCNRFKAKGFWRDSVAISFSTRRAEDGMLFSYEAINHALWWGVARLPDEIYEKLEEQRLEVVMGGGRGRGFGRAEIKFVLVEEEMYRGALGSSAKKRYLLWSPLPLVASVNVSHVIPSGRVIIESWSEAGIPRPGIPALAPGSLLKVNEDPLRARFYGLLPPHGSAEPFTGDGIPVSLHVARKLIQKLVGDGR